MSRIKLIYFETHISKVGNLRNLHYQYLPYLSDYKNVIFQVMIFIDFIPIKHNGKDLLATRKQTYCYHG